jgi:2-polyprenyl-3-methyl-5-hydroxy-6-metoxy-1,4-benzoquinol methylase
MSVEEFLDLFIQELASNTKLRNYYRLINSSVSFHFRKAYLHQRLSYVDRMVTKPGSAIWDIGCGYANTALYLTLKGHTVTGTTLEYYYEQIQSRMDYWSRYGNLDRLSIVYQDLFDVNYAAGSFDYVITQDTLHHLEPIDKALQIIASALSDDGRLIVSEENGRNLFIRSKNYLKRGNKRVITFYDPRLNKSILLGNENVRSYEDWMKELRKTGLFIDDRHTEFIRLYPPLLIRKSNYRSLIGREQQLWKKSPFLKNYFFFGINFLAGKASENI